MVAHDVLTYVSARSVGFTPERVKVTQYSYEDVDKSLYNFRYSPQMREGERPTVTDSDPLNDENEYYRDFVGYMRPNDGHVPVLQVLSLYSAEPDWGMDNELKISPLQNLTGGSMGYRHLRYGLFFFRAGVAHLRAEHFTRMADEAFQREDVYWGIRFSARAIHYIEDILTPIHTKPFSEWYALKKFLFPKKMFHTAKNYHANFEGYIAYRLWSGDPRFISAIEEAEPCEIGDLKSDLLRASRRIRRLSYPVLRECRSLWGDSMELAPVKLCEADLENIRPSERFEECVTLWLGLSASFVKGYILRYLCRFLKAHTP
jgi:hypothetical protein